MTLSLFQPRRSDKPVIGTQIHAGRRDRRGWFFTGVATGFLTWLRCRGFSFLPRPQNRRGRRLHFFLALNEPKRWA